MANDDLPERRRRGQLVLEPLQHQRVVVHLTPDTLRVDVDDVRAVKGRRTFEE